MKYVYAICTLYLHRLVNDEAKTNLKLLGYTCFGHSNNINILENLTEIVGQVPALESR